METAKKTPVNFGKAAIVFVFTFVCLLVGIVGLGTSAHMPLVLASIVAAFVGVSSGFKWSEMEAGMSETIKASAPAILIMYIIGMVIGTWILGGVVPTMIYYGLKILSPQIFLVASCFLCIIVSTLRLMGFLRIHSIMQKITLLPSNAGIGTRLNAAQYTPISAAIFKKFDTPLAATFEVT